MNPKVFAGGNLLACQYVTDVSDALFRVYGVATVDCSLWAGHNGSHVNNETGHVWECFE